MAKSKDLEEVYPLRERIVEILNESDTGEAYSFQRGNVEYIKNTMTWKIKCECGRYVRFTKEFAEAVLQYMKVIEGEEI